MQHGMRVMVDLWGGTGTLDLLSKQKRGSVMLLESRIRGASLRVVP